MTQEQKDLLIKDLCARLPYGVKGKCEIDASYDTSFDTIFQTHKFDAVVYGINEDLLLVTPLIEDEDEQNFAEEEVADGVDILDFTPYLFPLLSMTTKQKAELSRLVAGVVDIFKSFLIEVEFYHKYHIDYRGLIPMGLAIDATGLNIY